MIRAITDPKDKPVIAIPVDLGKTNPTAKANAKNNKLSAPNVERSPSHAKLATRNAKNSPAKNPIIHSL
jgi:hypothetical protein